MSNRTLLAAELARRIPALQADCAVNNETIIKGLIEQYLGPEILSPASSTPKPCYCLGRNTIELVANNGQLITDHVDFVAASDLFQKNPYAVTTDCAQSPHEVRLPMDDAYWLSNLVPTFKR